MKTLVIFLSFSLTLFGMSYEQFKRHTLKNSKILKSQTITLQSKTQENNILLRTANPVLNIEGFTLQ